MYVTFIINKISILNQIEYILLVLLLVLFLALISSIILNVTLNKVITSEKNKLLKKEKQLINLKNSFENGQINAEEYKKRINNFNKNI